ncbi:polysaccharide deacetylase family protein [uncultured Draconibacterium sp.]|uniref:polysaccharide deacetylase family protein n=1 Tax=uncultured Draconibacterium sp. TaxID=1573823 RepID=UPI0029C70EAC|nr:polysaccharide deacetylase family protein [uncultured Draconibacterium sp.]
MNRKNQHGAFRSASLLALITFILLLSCNEQNKQGAVVFSFDDQYIDEWYSQRNLFNQYNIKATFFISRPHQLKPDQIEKLKQLQADGHEIGCHGLNHLNAVTYKDSINVLIEKEIKPAIESLSELGFDAHSFAYPYGSSLPNIDSILLGYFDYLRKATYNTKDTSIDYYDDIFAKKDDYKVVNAMGIDTNFKITPENLELGLQRAKNNNEVLILYSHKIDSSLTDYTVRPEYLAEIFKRCEKLNIKSIRMTDLENHFQNH